MRVMEITIVGGFGGLAPNRDCTSLLINGKYLLDVGSAAHGLTHSQKKNLEAIFISHTHLDHIRELAPLCASLDNPIDVYCNKFTQDSLRAHIFNGVIYDNYIDGAADGSRKIIKFKNIVQGDELKFGDLTIIPIGVNHPCDAFGYVVKEKDKMVFFTIDTGPSPATWKQLASIKGELKAIFIDVSFPSKLQDIADVSGHNTPTTLLYEINNMPDTPQIFALHVKPFYLESVAEEIQNMGIEKIKVIAHDRQTLIF